MTTLEMMNVLKQMPQTQQLAAKVAEVTHELNDAGFDPNADGRLWEEMVAVVVLAVGKMKQDNNQQTALSQLMAA